MIFINCSCVFVWFRWKTLAEGVPHIIDFNEVSELPAEIRFSQNKTDEIMNTKMITWVQIHGGNILGSFDNVDSEL